MARELDTSRGTEALVRELLSEALVAQRSGRVPGDDLRQCTRAMCACARQHGVPIERVLVALKQEWRATPAARQLKRFEATTLLERIVTLCITEFYADPSAH